MLISHWNSVWWHYRQSTELLNKDLIVKKLLIPGTTLAWNSLGFRFLPWVRDLTIYENLLNTEPDYSSQKFNNIIAVNVMQLRYLTTEEHCTQLGTLCTQLVPGGRLQVGFNTIFLHWNRVSVTFEEEIDKFITMMKELYHMNLTYKVLRPYQTAALNGDCFLVFDKEKTQ